MLALTDTDNLVQILMITDQAMLDLIRKKVISPYFN